tara:strand:+ start:26607 stop:26879 length:273 start_codon:yes stop_codon:yes gene_type:complete
MKLTQEIIDQLQAAQRSPAQVRLTQDLWATACDMTARSLRSYPLGSELSGYRTMQVSILLRGPEAYPEYQAWKESIREKHRHLRSRLKQS